MKSQRVIALLLFAALFLALFSACKQNTESPSSEAGEPAKKTDAVILDYSSDGNNHYNAVHQLFLNHGDLEGAVFLYNTVFFYNSHDLYFANLDTGEEGIVETFSQEIESRHSQREVMHQLEGIGLGANNTILVTGRFSIGAASEPGYDPYTRILVLNPDGTVTQDMQLRDVEAFSPVLAQDQEGYTYLANRGTFTF